ncbi:hypothetical protein M8C21_011628 [Ambrosia artemisiifolia]|uniref:Uncharacterized protein n=1 Tax=Ambrosia artemisiifolia TaxID=4212 RepID=A0AAD5DCL3_AMBAR|nr:hypothetical protein M8C21_011628 [Ambrosia artemisiifolia]
MAGDHHPPLLTVVLTCPLTDPHNNPKPTSLSPPLTSPSSRDRRRDRRKSGSNRWLAQKIQTLTNIINPIPFVPKLLSNHHKHEHILKRLGLYNFSKVQLDRNINTDLLVQLIVSYNSKKKCSYVNGKRVKVNKVELAKALELPLPVVLKDGGVNVNDVCCYSDEEIGFIEDFVFNWVLLHEESWVMPVELVNGTRCVRDGCPEKLDAASLVWYKVEKELSQGVKLVDCYYASHLQRLIRVQYGEGFVDGGGEEQDGKVIVQENRGGVSLGCDGEMMVEKIEGRVDRENDLGERVLRSGESGDLGTKKEGKVSIVREDRVELNLGPHVEEIVDVREDGEMDGDSEGVENVKVDGGHEKKGHEEKVKVPMVQEDGIDLNLGRDVEKDDETMVDAEECEEVEVEVEKIEEQVNQENDLGECVLKRCRSNDLETKVEKVADEHEEKEEHEKEETVLIVQEEDVELTLGVDVEKVVDQDVRKYDETMVDVEEGKLVDEQIEQVEVEDDDEEEGGGDDGGRFVEGFDLEANDDTMDRDGLNDQIPYSSHGVSAIDLFGSRNGSFMSHGGPSFFSNSGKRVMELEEQTHHLDRNGKRLKAGETWDREQNDFGSCMVQAHQWVEKAKMIHNSTEEYYVNYKFHQDAAMNELQNRHLGMEMSIRSKNEELAKTNDELFRLERELYLMRDLVTGYRKALIDTRVKFSDYRKRVALQQKPLYKDAGPSGMVLSTRELEEKRGGKEH